MKHPNGNAIRNQVAQFNVNASELARVDQAAKALGLRRAQYLRMITLAALSKQEEEAAREPRDDHRTLGPVILRDPDGVY